MNRFLILFSLLIGFISCALSAFPLYSETPKGSISSTTIQDKYLSQVAPSTRGALRLLILYDNKTIDARLKADWGFSVLVDYDGQRLLFDTGAYGPILIDNMKRLGIDPWSIETIVISHDHYDHTGGLKYLLDMGIHPKIYVPSSFAITYKDSQGSQIELIEVDDSATIFSGLSVVCVKGMTVEEELVAETDVGSVVITGCAHPGLTNMVRSAQSYVPGKVRLLVGGFHLLQASEEASLKAIAEDLRSFAVERVLPTHCTSAMAIGVFKVVFGDRALDGGGGSLIEYPSSSAASQ